MPGGLFGGGGGSSSAAMAPSSQIYRPTAQPAADLSYQGLVQPIVNTGLSGMNFVGGFGSPYANAFGQAQDIYSQLLSPSTSPYVWQALQSADAAKNFGIGQLFPQATGGSAALYNAGQAALPYADTLMSQAFDPLYGSLVSQTQSNPYYAGALAGAQQGAGFGAGGAGLLSGAGNTIMNTGFDPQQALFNRSRQQLSDQVNATNAQYGLGSSPYGASVASNALGNFDINWQNQLAGRQQAAAASASPLLQAAPTLAATSAALPSQAYTGHLGDILAALQAQGKAGNQGAIGLTQLLGGAGGALGQGQNIGGTGATTLAQLGALPYTTGAQIGQTGMQGLSNVAGLGERAFTGIPQEALNALQSYLQLGQSAGVNAANVGNLGFNQTAQGIGGLLGGANTLFNPTSGLLTGTGGLLGSAASPFSIGPGIAGAGLSGAGLVGPSEILASDALGTTIAGGGGGLLGAAAPLALS